VCGGNFDCKDLIEGFDSVPSNRRPRSSLFTGSGHAVQGDDEVEGPALNCPMGVEMEFSLRTDFAMTLPRAPTREGWLTFGFDRDLDEATGIATVKMLKLMGELYGCHQKMLFPWRASLSICASPKW
jgi:acetamidase/formamidase